MPRPNSATKISAYVENMREVKARFQALPPFMQEKRIEVNSATAAAVVLGAQQRLLASPSIQTRALFNHVKWRINKANGMAHAGVTSGSTSIQFAHMGQETKKVRIKGIVIAGRRGSALHARGARLVRPSRYAHLVEFGTVHFAAEPFMKPAAAAQKDAYLHRWRAAMRDIARDLANVGGPAAPVSTQMSGGPGGGLL